MAWHDEYPSTTYRGPDLYPVPEDWVLNNVEMDGVMWYRYDDAENGHEAEHESDIDPDVTYEGPDNVAMLTADYLGVNYVQHRFDIDGEPIATFDDPVADEMWAFVAEVMARVARGEAYGDVEHLTNDD